ncbi:hypothetical protein [Pseudomonas sp. TCU-HL1]|uniref:hypothetical protein n=1 Tax=Pseudomonas sp. TCU-HL1 TaxID=1856685 RepID=UPI00083CC845|nr:hypothetical protein [Pseudomonas sp. TCU-HL1]AOE86994.1 hypothetical protein THL1_4446 [Pseudomonas sp. TCU-HL1]
MHPLFLLSLVSLGFSLFVFFYYRRLVVETLKLNRLHNYSDSTYRAVQAHFAELKDKEMMLTVDKGYGVIDTSEWEQELKRFVFMIVAPLLPSSTMSQVNSTPSKKEEFYVFATGLIKDLLCYDVFPQRFDISSYIQGR